MKFRLLETHFGLPPPFRSEPRQAHSGLRANRSSRYAVSCASSEWRHSGNVRAALICCVTTGITPGPGAKKRSFWSDRRGPLWCRHILPMTLGPILMEVGSRPLSKCRNPSPTPGVGSARASAQNYRIACATPSRCVWHPARYRRLGA